MDPKEKEKRMPKPTSARIKTGAFVILALSIIGAALLSWYNITFIGEDMLYSSHAPSFLPIIMLLAAVVASVAFSFMLRREKTLNSLPKTNDMAHQVICCLICASLLAITVLYIVLGTRDLNGGTELTDKLKEDIAIVLTCYMLYAVLAPVASLYFIKSAFGERKISVSLGCVAVLWFLLYLVRLYFDLSDMVEAPRKLTLLFAVCMAVLFLVCEIRFALGNASARKYFIFASLCAVSCISAGFAGGLCAMIGKYPTSVDFSYFVFVLLIGVYALERVFSVAYLPVAAKSEDAE